MRAVGARLGLLLLLAATAATAADPPVTDLADGRTGKIYFESVTPTGFFQLAKHEATAKTVIFGTLSLPKKATAPVPAMVIAHGSGGVSNEREFWWADHLNDMGVAAFVVDSFTPRNIRETATDQTQLSTAANVADALVALRLLATHPKLDRQRIGIMGFSKGGQVALYTALEPFRRAVITDPTRFAAHAPLYPACNSWQVSDQVTGAPMLILLGGRDTYTPPEPCQEYAQWFKSKSADVTVIVYPNAYHGFDSSRSPVHAKNVVTGVGCNFNIDLDRFVVTIRATGEDITRTVGSYARTCVGKGAMVGGDSEARRKSPEDVKSFLKKVFAL
ncbi:MAG TPA: dienelactone hydrolase family protein [Methylomirabilota bacterium]|nr:dienelactone hydrolase family protein [Methylomirabilota bacterium]